MPKKKFNPIGLEICSYTYNYSKQHTRTMLNSRCDSDVKIAYNLFIKQYNELPPITKIDYTIFKVYTLKLLKVDFTNQCLREIKKGNSIRSILRHIKAIEIILNDNKC